jgi:hypothetical protein
MSRFGGVSDPGKIYSASKAYNHRPVVLLKDGAVAVPTTCGGIDRFAEQATATAFKKHRTNSPWEEIRCLGGLKSPERVLQGYMT